MTTHQEKGEKQYPVQSFKAARQSHRFNANQKVWVKGRSVAQSDAYELKYKYRGSGRWVEGTISIEDTAIGEIKTINVSEKFFRHIMWDRGFTKESEIERLDKLIVRLNQQAN